MGTRMQGERDARSGKCLVVAGGVVKLLLPYKHVNSDLLLFLKKGSRKKERNKK
jgi:hypothetical protein